MEKIIKTLKEFRDLAETMADWEIIKYQEETDELKKLEIRDNIKSYFKTGDIITQNIRILEDTGDKIIC